MKKLFALLIVMCIAVLSTNALALDAVIDEVEFDGVEVFENSLNTVSIDRDQEVEVRVLVTGGENQDDVRVRARLEGYEYGTVSDETETYDMRENVTEIVRLRLAIPEDMEPDDYTLTVEVSPRQGSSVRKEFTINLDAERHLLKFENIVFRPGTVVEAGSALFANVRVENYGQMDEDSVDVTIRIPELGLSATETIEEVEDDEQAGTPDIYLPIPANTKPDTYTVEIVATYDRDHRTITETREITVLKDETPVRSTQQSAEPQQQIVVNVPQDTGSGSIETALMVTLVILIVVLLVVGLVVFVTKMKSDNE